MKQVILQWFIQLFALARMFPTNLTPPERLRGLIHQLHPLAPPVPFIRLGPPGDGGYLVPDDLAGIVACFSPGVGPVSEFERACAERGMQVFMADASVDGPATQHPAFHFRKLFVGAYSDGRFITLADWVTQSLAGDETSDLLLQMDIEGAEYEVLLATPVALLNRFRIIVLELHHLDQLWNKWFFHTASRALEKVLQTHACVHIHPNNRRAVRRIGDIVIPQTMEFTFLRRDRVTDTVYRRDFPHPLDSDNTTRNALPLPTCWYRGGA
ncbi:FkbM family methyltransferase [Chloroflexus sp.]|uniref:FkbM family methyltransferase n=1 Tax=Chloroflexus sp. TaxID=1904827 RepID=UPI002607238B|nr:FkbM family methyltransferase [uncultured Chloroflexus sp.]